MTDKTDALLALAAEIDRIEDVQLDGLCRLGHQWASRLRALAEQPAGAVGELIGYGSLSGEAWVRLKPGLPDGTKLYTAPPAASENVERLLREIRADAIAFATADTVGGDLSAMRRAMQRLVSLIDAAAGAKCCYPDCNCPFDAPADPSWCARGLPKGERS